MSQVKSFQCSKGELNYLEIINGVGNEKPTLFMLHGYGANMRDLAPLAAVHPAFKEFNWIFPDGPIKVPIGPMMFGRAWFPLDMEELNRAMMTSSFETLFSDKLPSGLAEASELLTQFIEAKAGGSYLLGGFSQGSMMACELSLNSSLKPEALVLLSSTLVAKERFVERLKKAHCLPVFQCHGISDPVLPISMARALKQQFNECAWEVDYHEFTGGHEIPPQALQALVTFLGAIK